MIKVCSERMAGQRNLITRYSAPGAWAIRELRICVRSWGGLTSHARQLVTYLTDEGAPRDTFSGSLG